jgi:type II secretory pathway component GspD/PulD (secretin)
VTLRLEEVRSRLAAVDALRTALRPMGIAVIDRGDFVAVARGSEQNAPVQAAVITPGQPSPPGGGVVVLTPRFISPGQLGPLVSPFAPSATIVQTDDRRRFLLVRGDEASISAISNAAAMFDVDWFAQVSVATFGLQHTTPDGMIAELKSILGPAASSVDLVPVPRLSQLIVLARDPQLVPVIRAWIERLDVSSSTLSPGLLVYRATNASAEALAESLREVGSGGNSPGRGTTNAGNAPPQADGALSTFGC